MQTPSTPNKNKFFTYFCSVIYGFWGKYENFVVVNSQNIMGDALRVVKCEEIDDEG